MRTYRNTKTGVVVCVESEVKGDWEEITNPHVSAEPAKTAEKPKRKRTPKK